MAPRQSKTKRALPNRINPQLAPDLTPEFKKLVDDRRLGRTNLSVSVGLVGTSNATKKENLGLFDYAHLKVPFPSDFKGSEIHPHTAKHSTPTSYFLMRRSSDGAVSASGMFKAAFPWATHVEEKAEKDYIKTLETTLRDEVAGNIWVPESFALELADEYEMRTWITALLDPTTVRKGTDNPNLGITPPPKYVFTANDRTLLPPPSSRATTPARPRGRPRAGSPTKNDKTVSPRKQRVTKATKAENAANAKAAGALLQDTLEEAASVAGSESAVDGEKVKVEVESTVQVSKDTETTTTNVTVKMPGGALAELPPAERTEEMVREAKEMVETARKLEGESSRAARKRKVEELDEESDEEADRELLPAKRARVAEQELKKERVRNRALLGMAATMAIGAMIPYVL